MISVKDNHNLTKNNNKLQLNVSKKEFVNPTIEPYKTFLSCMDDG